MRSRESAKRRVKRGADGEEKNLRLVNPKWSKKNCGAKIKVKNLGVRIFGFLM